MKQDPNDQPASCLVRSFEGGTKPDGDRAGIDGSLIDSLTPDLPAGWLRARLGALAETITKGATPTTYGFQYQKVGTRFVRVENITDGRINQASIDCFISDEAHAAQGRSQLAANDVLFSIAGPGRLE